MAILDRKELEEAFKRAAWTAVHGTRADARYSLIIMVKQFRSAIVQSREYS